MHPDELARTALSLWDLFAEEAPSHERLRAQVSAELKVLGLSLDEAGRVARITEAAFHAAMDQPAADTAEDFSDDPLYHAMLQQLDSGEWEM